MSLKNKVRVETNMLIFEFGGGSLDISILTTSNGGNILEVRSTAGNAQLGGEELQIRALFRDKRECEYANCTLSSSVRANIDIDSL